MTEFVIPLKFGRWTLHVAVEKNITYTLTGSTSAIDLRICRPDVFLDMQWKTYNDLCGNDHYPITISYGTKETSPAIPRWKLRKSDWLSKRRKRALRKVKVSVSWKYPTLQNHPGLKKENNKKHKTSVVANFVSSINSGTSLKKFGIWIAKISRKRLLWKLNICKRSYRMDSQLLWIMTE